MSNRSINTFTDVNETINQVAAYYALLTVIIGTFLNLLTLFVLCQSSFRDVQKRPTIHYMRAIAIFDIFMLYGWNLDHFMTGAFGFSLQFSSILPCKFFTFWNYFTGQCSAWLRVFVCLDRYLSLNYLHKTWFSQSKHVLMIIIGIVIVFFCINVHFFIFTCYYNSDGSLNGESPYYDVYPTFDYVNLTLYDGLPFLAMMILSAGVIYHLFHIRQTSTVQTSRIDHRSITITLAITTFLFLLMTSPVTILFAFFFDVVDLSILYLFDSILYTYHILSFPLYMISFGEFRRVVMRLVKCQHGINSESNTAVSHVLSKTH